jgi:hypothetical protein
MLSILLEWSFNLLIPAQSAQFGTFKPSNRNPHQHIGILGSCPNSRLGYEVGASRNRLEVLETDNGGLMGVCSSLASIEEIESAKKRCFNNMQGDR